MYFVAPARLYSPRAFQNRSWSGRARRGAGATEGHLEDHHYPVQLYGIIRTAAVRTYGILKESLKSSNLTNAVAYAYDTI